MLTTLNPSSTQTVKSFYGKANMVDNGGTVKLISYNTEVASYDKSTGITTIDLGYSNTTNRHIIGFVSEMIGISLGNMADLRAFMVHNKDIIKEA